MARLLAANAALRMDFRMSLKYAARNPAPGPATPTILNSKVSTLAPYVPSMPQMIISMGTNRCTCGLLAIVYRFCDLVTWHKLSCLHARRIHAMRFSCQVVLATRMKAHNMNIHNTSSPLTSAPLPQLHPVFPSDGSAGTTTVE